MTEIKIRKMTRRDKPSLMSLLRDTPEFTPAELIIAEEVIDSYLKDTEKSGYFTIVSVEGNAVNGYLCYGPTPLTEGTWDLYWAAVSRSMRGKGIGKALWEIGEADIRKQGGRLAIIETSSKPNYESTRRFHEARGYKPVGSIADFYAIGDDKIMYVKRLQ
jgi:ribosomal protein S18 acetylase RimI-like enzyme